MLSLSPMGRAKIGSGLLGKRLKGR
jgi:hypothetical protein